jgi:hypothetical protein
LAADARALKQEQERIGEHVGVDNLGLATQFGQAPALRALELFDHPPRRMIVLGKLDGRVGHVASASIIADAGRAAVNPGAELGQPE